MKPTLAATTVAILSTTVGYGHARADAPGACECEVTAAPAAAPTSLPRWGLGLGLGSLGVADPANMDAEPTTYAAASVHVRYRLRPRWQLELAFAHATERTEAGAEPHHLDAAGLAALYHPRPHARWDLYLRAGLGTRADGAPDLDDDAREASRVPTAELGVGVERRFPRLYGLAIGAELRAIAVGAPAADATARMTSSTDGEPEGTVDGAFSLAATYYF